MSNFRFRLETTTSSSRRRGREYEPPQKGQRITDPQDFVFVGGASCKEGNASTRRRFKQHVVRDYMQKKRISLIHSRLNYPQPLPWFPKAVDPGDFPKPPQPHTGYCQPLFAPPRNLGSLTPKAAKLLPKNDQSEDRLPSLAWDADPELPDQVPEEIARHLPGAASPQTFLSAARKDPFAAYPFECGPVEHQILNFRKF